MITKKEVITKLVAAKNLIKKGWCKNHQAEGKSGRPVSTNSRYAVKFCASGALRRVSKDNRELHIACLYLVEKELPRYGGISDFNHIANFNDKTTTTKKDIIDLFNDTLMQVRTAPLLRFSSCGRSFSIE